MKYLLQTSQKNHLLRLYIGEDILESLQKFCDHNSSIGFGRIQGIGAVSAAKLGFFDGTNYLINSYSENLEIVSLSGNISIDEEEGGHIVHIHGVFSRKDGSCIGGHIFPGCTVSATCEIQIQVLEPKVVRKEDMITKLKLLELPNEIE
ncbi:MAG: DNA-binding protein [Candidatus Heimdallarchaeota archaeon]|nr:MAG: DNA-binding protein [Candidatus Heimdallarchaeota archaeon]